VLSLSDIINDICKWGFKMEELIVKLLSDFIFAGVLLVLYRESLRRQEDQTNFHREFIKQQYTQMEKSMAWYQTTITNFMRGAARV
jgi:hypothetical protein